MPKATQVKNEDSSNEDCKPYASPSTTKTKKSPTKNKSTTLFYGEKRTGPWTAEEDRALFNMLFPRATVPWENVVREIPGRDVKVRRATWSIGSCSGTDRELISYVELPEPVGP
jgi:hypothetical protein